jgi:CheY-specific phosphatase CheX
VNNSGYLDDWLQAAIGAAAECSKTTLSLDLSAPDEPRLPPELTGCFIALVGDAGSLQIGFGSDPAGCQTLARALFASEDDLPEEDVSDALGEIANIIAGGVKKRMSGGQSPLALGLPIVMCGHVRLTERQQVLEAEVQLGNVPVRLLVISNKR